MINVAAQACKVVEKGGGDIIFNEGDPPDQFYIVQSGTYRASMHNAMANQDRKVMCTYIVLVHGPQGGCG